MGEKRLSSYVIARRLIHLLIDTALAVRIGLSIHCCLGRHRFGVSHSLVWPRYAASAISTVGGFLDMLKCPKKLAPARLIFWHYLDGEWLGHSRVEILK